MSLGQNGDWAAELFVNDDGSADMAWCVAEGRSALDAAAFADRVMGLGEDGFSVSMVFGVIEPVGDGEARFRKVDPERAAETIAMWEVEVA